MKTNKTSIVGDDRRTRQLKINAALNVLNAHGLEVFTLSSEAKYEDYDWLGDQLKRTAYNRLVDDEADDIEADYKAGTYGNRDELTEAIEGLGGGYSDDDALDIIRYTSSRDAYESNYGNEHGTYDVIAQCAFHADVRAELERRGVDLDDPGAHRFNCHRCGDVHSPETDVEECPACALCNYELERGFHVEDGIVCEQCLEDNESTKTLNETGEYEEYVCERCKNPFVSPKS